MRADARLNRERILSAAQDAIIEHGPEVSLDVIAARAGVGIGTLYRRFPNRTALFQAVVTGALGRIVDEEERALAEESGGWAALERYLRRALDLRVGAVIPMLVEHSRSRIRRPAPYEIAQQRSSSTSSTAPGRKARCVRT